MFDAASRSDVHQRAIGELKILLRRRDDVTALANLRQQGCLKARFPRSQNAGWTDIVTLNTSGGIVGGDRLTTDISLQPDSHATFAAQAAERIYRALPDAAPAQIRTTITLAAGAAAEYLPQETILFDNSALDRTLDISLAPDSWFLGVESLVFGRAAMGEQVHHARLRDRIRIRRDNRLILNDSIFLHGNVARCLARPAIAAGGRATATLLHAAPDAAASLDMLRAALAGADAGASAWDGLLVARILAPDAANLRQTVLAALRALRACRKLPRVWQC
jgi:urease accessory protein